jgi:hypothetical protein
MRLSDIMGHLNLAIWPLLALGLFVLVFAVAVVRALGQSSEECRRAAALPLDDEQGGMEPAVAGTDSKGTR